MPDTTEIVGEVIGAVAANAGSAVDLASQISALTQAHADNAARLDAAEKALSDVFAFVHYFFPGHHVPVKVS